MSVYTMNTLNSYTIETAEMPQVHQFKNLRLKRHSTSNKTSSSKNSVMSRLSISSIGSALGRVRSASLELMSRISRRFSFSMKRKTGGQKGRLAKKQQNKKRKIAEKIDNYQDANEFFKQSTQALVRTRDSLDLNRSDSKDSDFDGYYDEEDLNSIDDFLCDEEEFEEEEEYLEQC